MLKLSTLAERYWTGFIACLLSADFCYRFADHVDDNLRRRDEWRMVDGMRPDARTHSLGHKALGSVDDHAVLLCDEKPGGPILPERTADRHRDAGGRYRPLN